MTQNDSMTNHKTFQGKGPLKGLRVVELGMLFAGPLVATNLADLGAEVIKIEHPKGDVVRGLGQGKTSLWWSVVARNKKLVAVDVKKPEGADVIRKLLEKADVEVAPRFGRVSKGQLVAGDGSLSVPVSDDAKDLAGGNSDDPFGAGSGADYPASQRCS